MARIRCRDHTIEVRELALNELGNQFDLTEREANLPCSDVDGDRLVAVVQQALHFEHGLAWHDDFVARLDALGPRLPWRCWAKRWPSVATARKRPGSNTSNMPLR